MKALIAFTLGTLAHGAGLAAGANGVNAPAPPQALPQSTALPSNSCTTRWMRERLSPMRISTPAGYAYARFS